MVVRGFEYSRRSLSSIGFDGWLGGAEPKAPQEPEYDRSYEGVLFLALQVCGPLIACRAVAVSEGCSYKKNYIGKPFSFNTTELKVWPVTPAFVAAMTGGAK